MNTILLDFEETLRKFATRNNYTIQTSAYNYIVYNSKSQIVMQVSVPEIFEYHANPLKLF